MANQTEKKNLISWAIENGWGLGTLAHQAEKAVTEELMLVGVPVRGAITGRLMDWLRDSLKEADPNDLARIVYVNTAEPTRRFHEGTYIVLQAVTPNNRAHRVAHQAFAVSLMELTHQPDAFHRSRELVDLPPTYSDRHRKTPSQD